MNPLRDWCKRCFGIKTVKERMSDELKYLYLEVYELQKELDWAEAQMFYKNHRIETIIQSGVGVIKMITLPQEAHKKLWNAGKTGYIKNCDNPTWNCRFWGAVKISTVTEFGIMNEDSKDREDIESTEELERFYALFMALYFADNPVSYPIDTIEV